MRNIHTITGYCSADTLNQITFFLRGTEPRVRNPQTRLLTDIAICSLPWLAKAICFVTFVPMGVLSRSIYSEVSLVSHIRHILLSYPYCILSCFNIGARK